MAKTHIRLAGNPVTLTRASDIPPTNVRWAWKERIPLGAVTLMVGTPGLGKSTTMYDRVARLARGTLEGDLLGEPVAVLIATAEDDAKTVVVPRLMAAGADLDRVYIVTVTHDDIVGEIELPKDMEKLGQRVAEKGAKFLFVDPLVAHISMKLDAHRDQHVRAVLAPLRRLAEEHDIAVVATVHLNKRESSDVLTRVGGSVGFGAAPRSVLLLAEAPDGDGDEGRAQMKKGKRDWEEQEDAEEVDKSLRILAHAKCNLGPLAPSLRLRVEEEYLKGAGPKREDIITSKIVWGGEVDISAQKLLAGGRVGAKTKASDQAVTFLRDLLGSGPLPALDVRAVLDAEGIKERAWKKAKGKLGIDPQKDGFAAGWTWSLPPSQPKEPMSGERPSSEKAERERAKNPYISSKRDKKDSASDGNVLLGAPPKGDTDTEEGRGGRRRTPRNGPQYLRLVRPERDNAGALRACEKRTEKSPDWKGGITVGRFGYRLSTWTQQTRHGDDYLSVKAGAGQGGGQLFCVRGPRRTDVYRGDLTIAGVKYRVWGRRWTNRYGRAVVSLVALPKELIR